MSKKRGFLLPFVPLVSVLGSPLLVFLAGQVVDVGGKSLPVPLSAAQTSMNNFTPQKTSKKDEVTHQAQ